jgi:hypothetical protein
VLVEVVEVVVRVRLEALAVLEATLLAHWP